MESTLLIYIIFLALAIAGTATYIAYIKKYSSNSTTVTIEKTKKIEENKQIKELNRNYKKLEDQFHDFMIATKLTPNPELKNQKTKEETTK